MNDLHRLRRYDFQEGDGTPNDDLAELIGDIHWAADEIERLEAELKESKRLAFEMCVIKNERITKLETEIKDHFDRQPALNTDDPLYVALAR